MNTGRKTVTSVSLGAALAIIASAVAAEVDRPVDGGWFMYSPDSTDVYLPSAGGHSVVVAAVWLAAVAIWFAVSWWIFRPDE